MNAQVSEDRLIWIDLEMTGLDPDRDSILEIASIVTDKELTVLAEGPELAIAHPAARLEAMDDWNRNQHSKSGLWKRVLESTVGIEDAEARTLEFLAQWAAPNRSPICGNTICQDRRFLYRLMPKLEKFFHYRNLDVSTVKELCRRWYPEAYKAAPAKAGGHRAMDDIRESVAELAYYRTAIFQPAPAPAPPAG